MGPVASAICSSAGPGGCYHDQDAGEWFLEHGQTLQNASLAVAGVAVVFALGAPAAVAGGTAKAGALAQGALWSRAGPAVGALVLAGGARAPLNALSGITNRLQAAAQSVGSAISSPFSNIRLPASWGSGYRSFESFKNALGRIGPGHHWHHIVEKGNGNEARFGKQMIHNAQNLIPVDWATHAAISRFYQVAYLKGDGLVPHGMAPRNWLLGQSFEAQKSFGLQVLQRFGVIP